MTRQRAVDDYLRRLERSMHDLPSARRDEIVGQIREHIADALAEMPVDATGADVDNVLGSLGDPDDIATEARERFGIVSPRPRWTDTAAVVLLPIGGLVLPVVGWVVGVAFLWMSAVWTTRDKVIGTLIVPGGLLLPAGLGLMASRVMRGTGVVEAVVLIALLIAPIVVAVHLGRKLRVSTTL